MEPDYLDPKHGDDGFEAASAERGDLDVAHGWIPMADDADYSRVRPGSAQRQRSLGWPIWPRERSPPVKLPNPKRRC